MKSKVILFVLLALFFVTGVSAFGLQDEPGGYSNVFVSLTSIIVAVPIVVEFLKDKLNLIGLPVQILSWTLGILLSLFGYFVGLGMFADMSLLLTILTGAGASLVANGIADTGLVTWLLGLVGKKARIKK